MPENNNQNFSEIHQLLNDGKPVSMAHPDMGQLADEAYDAFSILSRFNQTFSLEKARAVLGELIGMEVPDTTTVYPPFYTNYGKNIKLGKNVFINHACSILDLGKVVIEDDVMIAPRVNITSENHPVPAEDRKTLVPGKVLIKKNAWIGAGVTILPGVTIGTNAVVAAGAVVTKDVPNNTVVAGTPARVIKTM
jgi:acetyltransferase-like isoleucine patch superfamily enzyme